MWHGRLVQLVHRQQRVAGGELGVARHQNRRQNWALNALVVIGIDANFLLFRAERELAELDRLQLVMALEIGPAPDSTVYDVRQPFAVRNLKEFEE